MRNDAPLIAPFLRSDSQARILADVLLREGEHTLSEIRDRTSVPLPTVQREVDRLSAAGVFETRKIGRNRVVTANTDYPLYDPLAQIVAATYGPTALVQDTLSTLDGVKSVVMFGSWAARMKGHSGQFPGDIDVAVIGEVDRVDAYMKADDLTRKIGRPVNVTLLSEDRWLREDDGLVRDIKNKPHLEAR